MNIKEIIPFLYLCDMYVGNDSFSHHVTSQCNKPSIVLLLNTPKAYSDYSINHHRIIPDNVINRRYRSLIKINASLKC